MREVFVTDLVKDILGPRGGAFEMLTVSPLSEYITGILAPAISTRTGLSGDTEIPELSGTADIEEDDTTGDADVQVPPLLQPALDPRNLPSSFGISFAVRGRTPSIEVCLTWARYKRDENTGTWKREPRYAYLNIELAGPGQVLYIDSTGRNVSRQEDAEISFHITIRKIREEFTTVNLYMVNCLKVHDTGNFNIVEYHIFQPQIRVVCGKNTEIISMEELNREASLLSIRKGEEISEEEELAFLYRHRPVKARGFLCSAIWKDIDPHSSWDGTVHFPDSIKDPPFGWPDCEILPDDLKRKFFVPDVRSEFVPVYSIPSPDMGWPSGYGTPPELRAGVLAETFDPDELRKLLQPLIDGYESWIRKLKKEADGFHSLESKIADRLITGCNSVLERMRKGIDLLTADENVRLAFCFANKAMDLQSQWTRKKPLEWRPFQLGYILTVLESLANRDSGGRNTCDLLWVPTGGGKTEAYLFLIAFILALRRRRYGYRGAGISVITRYTLRLLTIQQFRRLLSLITACEYLRVENLGRERIVGWTPPGYAPPSHENPYFWGAVPFGAGLWVGGGVTPNRLRDVWRNRIPGAISILKGETRNREGEPAQVTNCPACESILSVPSTGISGKHVLHLVIRTHSDTISPDRFRSLKGNNFQLGQGNVMIKDVRITPHSTRDFFTISIELDISGRISPRDIDTFWNDSIRRVLPRDTELVPARASRPGYFIRWYNSRGEKREYDFEIFCPSPECPLRKPWCAGAPLGWVHDADLPAYPPSGGIEGIPDMPDGLHFVHVQNQFRLNSNPFISDRIPVPACTVDEQVYHRLPSVVVATADKFARPPFEPRASALFGNVDHYHPVWGYYRKGIPPLSADSNGEHPFPAGSGSRPNRVRIEPLDPPDLIIQDELHLIEGPLGSLAGAYETAVDFLCREPHGKAGDIKPKYIASTATVRNAADQVGAIFTRGLLVFPPPGLNADDRFFIRDRETHPLDDSLPGRLYVGVCAPGKGALTPLVRIYARLLQTAEMVKQSCGGRVDPYWTLTCYFNAVRELGGARALCRDDVPERLRMIAEGRARHIMEDRILELSSRIDSTGLPSILNSLMVPYPGAPDILLTTSMFGTGVDVPRLALMVVNGQPKTTSSYIQATGRVGRSCGALVVTFFRASRPRDLSHYEFFCGYHRQLHRFVEPVTVYPFAPRVLEKTAGPVSVFILRNMRNPSVEWYRETSAADMARYRGNTEVQALPDVFERRASAQPVLKRPASKIRYFISSELDRWQNIARLSGSRLRYVEYPSDIQPKYDVVLGDSWHLYAGRIAVYEMVPQSLREIEDTCGFQT